jgi:predicted anti-sigma-YlaC factor YlaD
MQHAEFTLLMSAALDGEASGTELVQLHEHLRHCADCRATWETWQALDVRLGAEPALAAPAGMAQRVIARIDEAELRRRRLWWLGSGLAVSWLAVMMVGILAGTAVFAWLTANLQEVGALASIGAAYLSAATGLLTGVTTAINSVGAPTVAAVMGGLACMTCALAVAWLWLLGRERVVA